MNSSRPGGQCYPTTVGVSLINDCPGCLLAVFTRPGQVGPQIRDLI